MGSAAWLNKRRPGKALAHRNCSALQMSRICPWHHFMVWQASCDAEDSSQLSPGPPPSVLCAFWTWRKGSIDREWYRPSPRGRKGLRRNAEHWGAPGPGHRPLMIAGPTRATPISVTFPILSSSPDLRHWGAQGSIPELLSISTQRWEPHPAPQPQPRPPVPDSWACLHCRSTDSKLICTNLQPSQAAPFGGSVDTANQHVQGPLPLRTIPGKLAQNLPSTPLY